MDYKFKKEAKEDLDEIYKYYQENAPGKGRDFVKNLKEKLNHICKRPLSYSQDNKTEIRKAPIKNFDYYLYYIIRSPYIVIIAIWHTARLQFDKKRMEDID